MKILIDNGHGIDTKGKRSPGQRLRTDYTDPDPDLESDFYLLRHTLAPAVLVENLRRPFCLCHPPKRLIWWMNRPPLESR